MTERLPKPRRLVSKIEAAKILHTHTVTIMAWARAKEDFPRAIWLGSKVFFDLDEIEAWIERQRLPKKGEADRPDPLSARADHLTEARKATRA